MSNSGEPVAERFCQRVVVAKVPQNAPSLVHVPVSEGDAVLIVAGTKLADFFESSS